MQQIGNPDIIERQRSEWGVVSMSNKERLSPQQKRRQRHRQERRVVKARIGESLHKDTATRRPRTPEPVTYEERLKAIWPTILTVCVIPGGYGLAMLTAKRAPAFLRWALGEIFSRSRGVVWRLLQAESWGQLPLIFVAIGGIPMLIWTFRYALRTGSLKGSNAAASGMALFGFLPLVLLLLPWMMVIEEYPLETFRTCQADLTALSKEETLVYEGKLSQVEFYGDLGVDEGDFVFYKISNLRYACEPQIQMWCPIELGKQVELYTFWGGQATGRDSRRFRVEYLPNTGIVLSLEVLTMNDKDASG